MTTTVSEPTTTEEQAGQPKRSIRWGRVLVWVGVFALLALLGWGLLNASAERPEAGVTAPTFDMQFFDGYGWNDLSSSSLEEMRGNVVVLNFWASWCVECRLEADLLQSAWAQYRDQGVVFLGVAYVDSEPKSLEYLQQYNIDYPNAPDLGSTISDQYEITGVPETFFIDKEGTISRVIVGPVSASVLHNEIGGLLAQ
jgi:cytochrome c biogenesis protein CcmG/thiol:disulfide interchange protein DsbE